MTLSHSIEIGGSAACFVIVSEQIVGSALELARFRLRTERCCNVGSRWRSEFEDRGLDRVPNFVAIAGDNLVAVRLNHFCPDHLKI